MKVFCCFIVFMTLVLNKYLNGDGFNNGIFNLLIYKLSETARRIIACNLEQGFLNKDVSVVFCFILLREPYIK